MIKRISFLFCTVLIVVTMLAVPTFATEVQDTSNLKIIKQPKDYVVKSLDSTAFFSIVVSGEVSSYKWQYCHKNYWYDATWADSSPSLGISLNEGDYKLVRCVVTGVSGDVVISDVASIVYKDSPLTSFIERCIYFVTSWVGTIVSSLVSPEGVLYPLLPILAIGIAVTAALLVVKIFKSFSWGL